ncbi:hypothetical protein EN858_14820 [Mesorhizobium sp. M4B.F.Ca.ET.215.01.1.1]|uniref:hypothetical protein n=1 Tax=unclassified Mesorhizobium TaxID=325217 RepID=UPI00109397C4|nr:MULTISPECIES: hypothetical protein [unclassified Mesorhizobium]TGQ11193.1 hypothetical protein EN858_14820 [Mesorhizobium sp. M4B.F.Ca.ET.215.01.1.1]TGR04754.1 hypothetical protein EN846_13260 [Mesorhizobium sp. M4B.F.Ca.ET.203.01.1.1]
MSENTKLWDLLGRTDPSHTTQFKRGGGFSGTAIKPMWSYRRMTEEFGPCGVGWGIEAPQFQVLQGAEDEKLVFCTVSVWYVHEGERHQLVGVGGDKAVTKNKYGLASDDEAFKKAFTDSVTNALKFLGVGADVHMGLFDDNKYVNTMRHEFSDAPAQKPSRHSLKKDIGDITKPDRWDEFERELLECTTIPQLNKFKLAWSAIAEAQGWQDGELGWRTVAREEINKRQQVILNGLPDDDTFPGDRPSNGNYVSTIQAG